MVQLRKSFGDKRDQQTFDSPRWDDPAPENQFCLVLIRQDSLLGPLYFLERRTTDDPEYRNRIGLYGGKRDKDESRQKAAVREIEEETGLKIAAGDLSSMFYFLGENDARAMAEGEVFRYRFTWSQRGRPTKGKIRAYQKAHAADYKSRGEKLGPPIVIRRWFGKWFPFLDWRRLTPQVAYALITDLDRDRMRR